MKPSFQLLIALCVLAVASNAWADKDSIVGVWLTEKGQGKIQIFKCGDNYCGKTVWISPSVFPNPKEKKDVNNPDASKRNRKVWGMTMLWGLKYDGDDRWKNGIIYDPDRGITFNCRARLVDSGNTLKFRGYLKIPLLGKTTTWTRVK